MRRLLAWLGPDFGLAVLFFIALSGLIGAYGGAFEWKEGTILISTGICVGLVVLRTAWSVRAVLAGVPGARAELARGVRDILRDWGPLVLVLWMFQSLETYTGVIGNGSIDATLYRADLAMFGTEPTVWLSRHQTPLLTDYMAFAYGSYFVVPMVLALSLSLRGRREDFREMCTAVVLQMCIGFLLFLLFPAGPPRYYEPLVHGGFDPPQLHSYFGLYELQQGVFDTADPVRTRSAFPSLHCSLAVLTLVYSHRFGDAVFATARGRWFRLVLPLMLSLFVSVIYLRHHWMLDVFAGVALGLATVALAPVLRRLWPREVSRNAPSVADLACAPR